MFSAIIDFIQKVLKAKKGKQKYEMKKERKKEEEKIAKEEGSIAFSKEKAKKSKSVQELLEKVKKIDIKIAALGLLKWIVTIFEQFILWVMSFFGITGFFVAIVAVIVLLIFRGIISIDMITSDTSLGGKDKENCIQGTQAMANTGYDLNAIGQLQGTMTEYEKNLYRALQLYTEVVGQSETAIVNSDELTQAKNIIGPDNIAKFLLGFSACETGLKFNNGERNILEYPSKTTANSAGYAFLGLHHRNTFDGTYKYNGSDSTTCLNSSFVTNWKAKYQPKETPIYDNNYVPYGVATQTGNFFHGTSSGNFHLVHSTVESELPAIMDAYGIIANRDKLTTYVQLFAGAASYHSGVSEGKSTGLYSILCALWSATSDVDANRSFDNIKIIYNSKTDYTESTARKVLLGPTNFVMSWDKSVTPYFAVNGQKIDVTFWTWVRDNCSNKEYFNSTCVPWFSSRSGVAKSLNAHYGLLAYLMGNRIVDTLGGTVPIVSGGNIEDCECYEVSTGSGHTGNIDISNIKTGVPQGPWSSSTIHTLNSQTETIKGYYGKVSAITNPTSKLTAMGITKEEWRQQTKWKVPHYHQSNGALESGEEKIPWSWVSSLSSLGNAGCHVYMHSYMASALTGTVINPVEMLVAGRTVGGIGSTGLSGGSSSYKIYNDLGLKAITRGPVGIAGDLADGAAYFGVSQDSFNSNSSSELQKVVDAVLAKDGIFGFAGGPGYFTKNTNHYVVITEKTSNGYRVMGYNSAGVYPDPSWASKDPTDYNTGKNAKTTPLEGDIYNWEYIFKGMYAHSAVSSGYRGQRFIAWNPTLSSSNGSALGGVSGNTQAQISEFSNFLFVGDSYTVNLESTITSKNKGHIVKAVGSARPDEFIDTTKGPQTVQSSTVDLSNISNINGIVVLLGVNGLGLDSYVDNQYNNMTSFLTELKAKYSTVPIYVQKVFHVGAGYSYGTTVTAATMNSSIDKYNNKLKAYCDSNGLIFIDTTNGLIDENGYLKTDDELHPAINGVINGQNVNLYSHWYNTIETVITGSSNLGSNQGGTNSYIDCVPKKSGGTTVSEVGALDLDIDVIDMVDECKPTWGKNNSGYMDKVENIIIHYWGSESSKRSYNSSLVGWYSGGTAQYLAQFIVDYEGAIQVTPANLIVWHAGGGIGNITNSTNRGYGSGVSFFAGNNNSIGIEVSNIKLSDGRFVFEKQTIEHAVALTKALMKEYNISVDHVLRHWDCVMKVCPAPFIDEEYGSISGGLKKYDNQQSQGWVAFKQALVSDTIDWSLFGDSVIDNLD